MVEVLVVGKGARENCQADLYAKSPLVDRVYVTPGNAGSSLIRKCERLGIEAIDKIVEFVLSHDIDLVDVGPEGYLTNGIVDEFYKAGFTRVVGQVKDAGILETSKCWAKDFFKRHDIPIPEHRNFDNPGEAKNYIQEFYRQNPGENVVVKADGICAGKGSLVCSSLDQALSAVDRIMVDREFDNLEKGILAGSKVVVERRMYGQEIMFFVATDGKGGSVKFAGTAYDAKRAFDYTDRDRRYVERFFGGINPNTGGVISISPHPREQDFRERIMREIAVPTIANFQKETGLEYLGIGYFGIMLSEEYGEVVPRIEEFNRRWGDPEFTAIGPRIRTDYYELASAIVERRLREVEIEWEPFWTYVLVAVSGGWLPQYGQQDDRKEYPGYPGKCHTKQPIRGLRSVDPECRVYHSGTEFKRSDEKNPNSVDVGKGDEDGNLETTGGRVLELVAKGATLEEAKAKAEAEIRKIHFKGMRYRTDHVEREGLSKQPLTA